MITAILQWATGSILIFSRLPILVIACQVSTTSLFT